MLVASCEPELEVLQLLSVNFSCPLVLISVAFDPFVSVAMLIGILKMIGISSALPVCPHRQSCFQCL